MKLSAILAPLIAAGVSGEVILATVKAFEEQQDNAIEKRRASDRERQQRHRNVMSRDVTVTRRDTPSSDKEKSPTPPKEINSTHETSSLRSAVCPEPEKSAPAQQSPAVIDLPSLQGQAVTITEADVSEWVGAFPAVDVRQQLRSMRQWLIANERQRKTPKGMRRFVVSWLSREQDRGAGRAAVTGQPQAPPKPKSQFRAHQDDVMKRFDDFLGIAKNDDELASKGPAFDLDQRDWRSH